MRAIVFVPTIAIAMVAGFFLEVLLRPCPKTVWRGNAVALVQLASATIKGAGVTPPPLDAATQAATNQVTLQDLRGNNAAIYSTFHQGCAINGTTVTPDDTSPLLVTSYAKSPNSASAGVYYTVTYPNGASANYFVYANGELTCIPGPLP